MTPAPKKELEVRPIEIEVAEAETFITTNRERAESLVIKTEEDYAAATDFAADVKTQGAHIDKVRRFFVDPLNQQVDNINAMFMPRVKEAKAVEDIIKGAMKKYLDAKEAARLKEQKRLDDIRDAANAKREEKGEEAIAEPVRQVAPVATHAVASKGSSTARKKMKGEVLHIEQLPPDIIKAILAEAWKKNIIQSVVQKFVDAGMHEIPGVRVYEDTIIAVGRRK